MALPALLLKAAPALAKQVPRLWPLLLETKNRQKLVEIGKDLASQSPKKRIEGRIEITATLAEAFGAKATKGEEEKLADDWAARARKLQLRLDMPIHDRKARKAHRAAVQSQLDDLQAEMNTYLEQ